MPSRTRALLPWTARNARKGRQGEIAKSGRPKMGGPDCEQTSNQFAFLAFAASCGETSLISDASGVFRHPTHLWGHWDGFICLRKSVK